MTNIRNRLRALLTLRDAQEFIAFTLLWTLITAAVFLLRNFESAIIAYTALGFFGITTFNTVWTYRNNRGRAHPLLYAVGVVAVQMVVAIAYIIALAMGSMWVYHMTGIPILLLLLVGHIIAFFVYATYKVKTA